MFVFLEIAYTIPNSASKLLKLNVTSFSIIKHLTKYGLWKQTKQWEHGGTLNASRYTRSRNRHHKDLNTISNVGEPCVSGNLFVVFITVAVYV